MALSTQVHLLLQDSINAIIASAGEVSTFSHFASAPLPQLTAHTPVLASFLVLLVYKVGLRVQMCTICILWKQFVSILANLAKWNDHWASIMQASTVWHSLAAYLARLVYHTVDVHSCMLRS